MAKAEILNIKTENADMDYVKFGKGEKPLVIIPGLSLKSVVLAANAVAKAYDCFSDDYTVYLIDRKNNIKGGCTVFDMAEDTAEVMSALGLEDAYVFGTSQGGMIAQVVAINHPELVKKLALGSSAARISDEAKKTIEEWISLAKDGKTVELCTDFVKRLYSKAFAEKYGQIIIKMNSDASEDEIKRFITISNACEGFDIREKLKNIKCPTLVLGAENDLVLTGEASLEIAEILGCECYMYPKEYGHAVYDEAPDYKERLINFFKD